MGLKKRGVRRREDPGVRGVLLCLPPIGVFGERGAAAGEAYDDDGRVLFPFGVCEDDDTSAAKCIPEDEANVGLVLELVGFGCGPCCDLALGLGFCCGFSLGLGLGFRRGLTTGSGS